MSGSNLSRRKFLTALGAGAGTVMLGKSVFALSGLNNMVSLEGLPIVEIGKTGIKTTLLGTGLGFSGYNRSSSITRAGTAEKMIRAAYDRGVRFFDCADLYGIHPFVAKALEGIPRDEYVICSKIWVEKGNMPEDERPDADVVIERFRKELNTDYIDIVQIHAQTAADWTERQKKQMDILDKLKAKGVIRAHGASIHSLPALKACVGSPWVDVVHARINPFGAAMDSKDPAQVTAVLEKLHEAGKGVIGMKLICNGSFRDDSEKIDQSLKFVLGLGTVDMIIVGFEQPEQIDDYMKRLKEVRS